MIVAKSEAITGQGTELRDKSNILRAIMIAGMYLVVTVITAQFSFLDIQLRITEALCILPMFTPIAIPGLFIGCLLANLCAGAPLADVIFGSLATLIGGVGTWMLRDKKPYIAILPPIVANLVIVPLILKFAYHLEASIPMMMLTVGLGEICACGVLGEPPERPENAPVAHFQRGQRALSAHAGWGVYSTWKAGVPCGIRTHGLLLRRQTLYPAELRGRFKKSA